MEIHGKMDLEDSFTYRSSESYSGAAKDWERDMGGIIKYYKQFADIQKDVQEIGEPIRDEKGYANMLMVNNGPVLNNNIEMLLLAWQMGKAQYYHGNNISEAMGR